MNTEINVLVNMQGQSLSIMLLDISLRQTRTWDDKDIKHVPKTTKQNKIETINSSSLIQKQKTSVFQFLWGLSSEYIPYIHLSHP